MKRSHKLLTGFATLMTALTLMSTSALAADEVEHCMFTQANEFVGSFKACQMPVSKSECKEIGDTGENSDATHGAGECPLTLEEKSVGICDIDGKQTIYYEGDISALEIGCGFQSGDWSETSQ